MNKEKPLLTDKESSAIEVLENKLRMKFDERSKLCYEIESIKTSIEIIKAK